LTGIFNKEGGIMTKKKRLSTKYAIKLVRLDEKTGTVLHELAAGHDDWGKFNKTDLQPFLDAFEENDRNFDEGPIEREKARRRALPKGHVQHLEM